MDLITWMKKEKWPNWILADRLGLTPQTLSKIRRGKHKPSLQLAKAIVAFTRGQVELCDLGVKAK